MGRHIEVENKRQQQK